MSDEETLLRLAVALGVGLIIGLERGFDDRGELQTGRVAGMRSFGLLGLLGGLCGVLALEFGALPLAAGLVVSIGAIAWIESRETEIRHILNRVTILAAIATFALGAVAVTEAPVAAGAGAVVVAWILRLKPVFYGFLARIEPQELAAVLQLLLVSLVVLPLLPNREIGPFGGINPFKLWWLVVLIVGISFVGYVAIKLFGEGRGVLLAGFAGGLVSSTATAVTLADRGRNRPELAPTLAGGILLASTVMPLRLAAIIGIAQPALLRSVAAPLLATAAAGLVIVIATLGRRLARAEPATAPTAHDNPFSLMSAIKLAALVSVVTIGSQLLYDWLGAAGLYVAAALSAVADVDAVGLSTGELVGRGLPAATGALVVLVAVVTNTFVKLGIVAAAGSIALTWRVALGFALMLVAAALGWLATAAGVP